MKKFIAGILVGVILTTGVSVYAETASIINVIIDRVNVVINGQSVDMKTILYEGRTYVPLRDVTSTLGMDTTWDSRSNTAYVDTPESLQEITPKERDYINRIFLVFEEIQVVLDDIYETVHYNEAPYRAEAAIEQALVLFVDAKALSAPDSLNEYKEKVDNFCNMNIEIFNALASYISENPEGESGFIEFFDSLYDTELLLSVYLEVEEALFNFLGQRYVG